MGNEKLNKLIIGFIFLLICFAIDRFSKIYILNILNNDGQVDLYVNQYLNIYLIWNTGIGFGLFSSENKSSARFPINPLIICFSFPLP